MYVFFFSPLNGLCSLGFTELWTGVGARKQYLSHDIPSLGLTSYLLYIDMIKQNHRVPSLSSNGTTGPETRKTSL